MSRRLAPHRSLVWIAATAFMLAISARAVADDVSQVKQWLDRMTLAVDKLTYQGTFVYFRNGQMESMRVLHQADDKGVRERLISLNGTPREILRDNDTVYCVIPENRSVLIDTQLTERIFPSIPAEQVINPNARYRFALGPTDRIAKLDAQIVDIRPLDPHRYGYRLWLETETGMLLKSTLLNEKGGIVEQLMFTEIDLGTPIDAEQLMPTTLPEGFRRVETPLRTQSVASRSGKGSPWLARVKVPNGFLLSSHKSSREKAELPAAEHLVFTDGLASISVYVEPESERTETLFGLTSMGAMHAYGVRVKGFRITVVGEVPPRTVEFVARSVINTSP